MSAARGIQPLRAALVAVGSALAHPLARWAGLGLLLTLLGVAVLGPTPGSVARELPPAADWPLPAAARPEAAGIAARRASAPLWASQPVLEGAASASAAAPAPPRLLAVFRDARGYRAVFQSANGSRQTLRPGEALAEGFELIDAGATHARLRTTEGRVLEQRLLAATAVSD